MGIDVSTLSDEDIGKLAHERARRFLEDAPMTAAEAATVILDGVKDERWRILVGKDAEQIDRMVREAPERAYDVDFFREMAGRVGLEARLQLTQPEAATARFPALGKECVMVSISGRRRLFSLGVAGGLVLAGPVLAPALARDTKKPGAEEQAFPPEILMRGHGIMARVLLIHEGGLRRMGQGEDIDPAVFVRAAEITKAFIHDHQEKMEDELVFAQFRKSGRMVELVGVLSSQHAAGAKITDKIAAAAPQARNREPREAMGKDVQALIAMYRPHMAREATDVFPGAARSRNG